MEKTGGPGPERVLKRAAYVILLLSSANALMNPKDEPLWAVGSYLILQSNNDTYVNSHQRRRTMLANRKANRLCEPKAPHLMHASAHVRIQWSRVQCWKPFKPIVSIIIWPRNIARMWTSMYILRPDLRCSEIIQTSILSCHLCIRSVSRDYPFDAILYDRKE